MEYYKHIPIADFAKCQTCNYSYKFSTEKKKTIKCDQNKLYKPLFYVLTAIFPIILIIFDIIFDFNSKYYEILLYTSVGSAIFCTLIGALPGYTIIVAFIHFLLIIPTNDQANAKTIICYYYYPIISACHIFGAITHFLVLQLSWEDLSFHTSILGSIVTLVLILSCLILFGIYKMLKKWVVSSCIVEESITVIADV
jgi:hypothetical protein